MYTHVYCYNTSRYIMLYYSILCTIRFMHVCIYIYIYIYMYVCMYVCMASSLRPLL